MSGYYMDLEIRGKIDHFLHLIAAENANIGCDSTIKEKKEINKKINEYWEEIKKIDKDFYKDIVMYEK